MRRDDHLLRSRVPEFPGLCAIGVANEDAFACVGLQRLALLLADEHVGQAAKDPEVGHIRLAPIALPGCVGNAAVERTCGHAVACVDKCRDGVAPKRRRELGLC